MKVTEHGTISAKEIIMEENKLVLVNTLYRHFKGNYYLVEKIAKKEEDGSDVIIYTSVATGETFVRPYNDFFTDVSEREDNVTHQVHRFEPANEINGLLNLIPTSDIVKELELRADNPYEGCKKIEEDENVWEVRFLLGRIVVTYDPKLEKQVEEFKPLTLATFETEELAKKYKNRCFPERPVVMARRIIRKIGEI